MHLPAIRGLRLSNTDLVTLLFVIGLSTLAAGAQGNQVDFVSPVSVGKLFGGAVAGDFNRDGKTDFVTDTMIVLNQGHGTFSYTGLTDSCQDYGSVCPPSLAIDLNGDGFPDLVYINLSGVNGFLIQFSNGDGTFRGPATYPLSENTSAVHAAADFNNDGRMDLALVTTTFTENNGVLIYPRDLLIFLNKGSGVFQQAASYPLGQSAVDPFPALVSGNLSGSHLTDLVVTDFAGSVTPYFATGNGAFKKGAAYSTGAHPHEAAIGDINKDGFGDIAVATDSGVTLLLGGSTGVFKPAKPLLDSGANFVVMEDFNHDGKLDLAVATSHAGHVSVSFGKGDGTFAYARAYGIPAYPVGLMAADINGNGRRDLVVATLHPQNPKQPDVGSLSILYNNGNGYFRGAPIAYSLHAGGITTGDFDHDGQTDAAVVNTPTCKAPCNGTVTIFRGSGSDWFYPGKKYAIGMHGADIVAGDLNHDGITDLVVTNQIAGDSSDLTVLLGNKDGTFQPAKNYTLGALSNHAVLVDVNKDGKLDLVEDSGVALGKGDGTFGPLISLFGSTNTTGNMGVGPGFADGFAVGDFNGDGFPDIVTAGVVIGTLLGKGDGTFTFNGYSSEVSANGIAVGDFNGDNALDVVYYSTDYLSGDAEVGILLGDGKGAFTTQNAPSIGLSIYADPTALTIADFNGDGKNDVGVAVPGAGLFAVLLGDGNGSWTGFANFAASSGTSLSPGREIYPLSGIAVADVKRDGKPDVLLTGDLGFSRLINVSKRP